MKIQFYFESVHLLYKECIQAANLKFIEIFQKLPSIHVVVLLFSLQKYVELVPNILTINPMMKMPRFLLTTSEIFFDAFINFVIRVYNTFLTCIQKSNIRLYAQTSILFPRYRKFVPRSKPHIVRGWKFPEHSSHPSLLIFLLGPLSHCLLQLRESWILLSTSL